MHRLWVFIAAAGFLASSAPLEEADLPDAGHHGYRHVGDAAEGHHHGDSDDHHESPDSPCHHHESQICLGHAPDLGFSAPASIAEPEAAGLLTIVSIDASDDPSIRLIFHIPIA